MGIKPVRKGVPHVCSRRGFGRDWVDETGVSDAAGMAGMGGVDGIANKAGGPMAKMWMA